jgi:tyrosine-protein kinase Etk/Wzc
MNTQESKSIKISVKDFLMRYVRYLPLFILSIGIALGIAYAYLRYSTPLYSARATMLIKTDKSSGGLAKEFDEVNFTGGRGNVANEIEILKSLTLAKRVATSLGLQKKYYVKGNIKTTLNYPEAPVSLDIVKLTDSTKPIGFDINIINEQEFNFANAPAIKYRFGQPLEQPGGTFVIVKNEPLFKNLQYKEHVLTWEPLENAAFNVLGGLGVAAVKDQSNILSVTYLGTHPQLAKDILNQLMEEYSKQNVEDKNQTAARTVSFVNERLNLITRELGDVEKDLQKYKQHNDVVNLESQSQLYLSTQSELDKQLSQFEVQKHIIGYLQEYMGNEQNNHDVVPTSLGIEDITLKELIGQYNELQLKREAQLRTTTPNNLTVKVMDGQLEKLRSNILENLNNVKRTIDLQINSLNHKNQQYNSRINSVPIKEKELLEITRQQGIKQSLYLFLLQKREETAISLAATVSNSQVVDAAIGSGGPVLPNPKNVKMLAVFLGLLVPVGFIYIRELLNDKIVSRPDITKITEAPIFGEIGHSEDKGVLLVRNNKRDVVTEQFRMIRSNIQYMVNTSRPVILVTSTFSGEGKSFISVNTGAVMALAGKKTVVLEMDIRKPKISKNLDLSRAKGISNFLVGNIPVESLAQPVNGVDNLYVIPCGPIPPNPSEMLLNEKLNELFDYVKKAFDVVIIDTAPIGLVSDAFTLSKYADSTLYIVRMGYTLKKQMHFIEELYKTNKLPRIGLLVNDIKTSSHYYSYGNYGGYGYGYGYGNSNGYYEASSNGTGKVKKLFKKIVKPLKG